MFRGLTHPSDQTLLLRLDGELPAPDRASLDHHLAECERCRSRSSALADVADELPQISQPDSSSASIAALRRRVQAGMAEQSVRWERSASFPLLRIVTSAPLVVGAAALLAIVAVALSFVRPSDGSALLTARLYAESLPIRDLTPGAADEMTREAVCSGRLPGRPVIPTSVRQDILRRYRMEGVPEGEYELDYLITPELGGTADPQNLWPERYASGIWNARVKDDLERLLPRLVCGGAIDLVTAQRDIADNWIAAYQKYLKTDQPVPRRAGVIDDDDDGTGSSAEPRIVLASPHNDPRTALSSRGR